MTVGLPPISYPALLWYEGYIMLVERPLNLCAVARSQREEMSQLARSGKLHLLDAEGRYFDIAGWTRIPPIGLTGIALLLIGTVFEAPLLTNETKLSLSEFKKKIAGAMRSRYRYDLDKYPAVEAIRQLEAADSYRAALGAVPEVGSLPWWRELLVGLGCLAILGVIVLACWLLGIILRP